MRKWDQNVWKIDEDVEQEHIRAVLGRRVA